MKKYIEKMLPNGQRSLTTLRSKLRWHFLARSAPARVIEGPERAKKPPLAATRLRFGAHPGREKVRRESGMLKLSGRASHSTESLQAQECQEVVPVRLQLLSATWLHLPPVGPGNICRILRNVGDLTTKQLNFGLYQRIVCGGAHGMRGLAWVLP